MATLLTKPLTWLKPDPGQPRRHYDDADLLALGESLRIKQVQPVLARPDGTLIAGERRWRAAGRAGLTELDVIVTDELLTESQIRVLQLCENLHRADLTDGEKWRACAELLRLNPGWSNKDLAGHLKLGESTVTKYLAPSRCVTDVQEALEAGRIGVTAAYEMSRVSPEQQVELLQLKLAGTTRDGLAAHVRRKRATAAPAARVGRVRVALPGGVGVVVSGEGVSLDDAIEALGEAQKEAKKARDQGLDAKTFMAVMRDKAKAGS